MAKTGSRGAGTGRGPCCGRPGSWPERGRAGPGSGARGSTAPVGGRALHPVRTGLSGVARRTLRTNQRFIARRAVPQMYPADTPLPRERAKAPYCAAEISGFLALADAQPTTGRRMRAAGLICLGAGAGLIRG